MNSGLMVRMHGSQHPDSDPSLPVVANRTQASTHFSRLLRLTCRPQSLKITQGTTNYQFCGTLCDAALARPRAGVAGRSALASNHGWGTRVCAAPGGRRRPRSRQCAHRDQPAIFVSRRPSGSRLPRRQVGRSLGAVHRRRQAVHCWRIALSNNARPGLAAILQRFERWQALRASLQFLTFAVTVWALAVNSTV